HNEILCRDAELTQRFLDTGGLVHIRRQHDERAIVRHELTIEAELLDRVAHLTFVRERRRDDGAADGQGCDAPPMELLQQYLGRCLRENLGALRRRLVQNRPVLGNDVIEYARPWKNFQKLAQLPRGDENQLASARRQRAQRVDTPLVVAAIASKRAVEASRECNESHCSFLRVRRWRRPLALAEQRL